MEGPRNVKQDLLSITQDYWVCASATGQGAAPYPRPGKWMIFTDPSRQDAAWSTIREATEQGQLGVGAKAATARPNPLRGRSAYLLTCVYTGDHGNHADVRRVLAALRELGFAAWLSYKAAEDTVSGVYGPGSAMYVSQPGALDFEDRRDHLATKRLDEDP